ncbi:MAG: DUF1702 family protein [Cyanobacteria bacterium REEB67]|nr:DUF1702 family protein [Cyanobacteria bacterium REEB67]
MDNLSTLVEQLHSQVRRRRFSKLLKSPGFKSRSHRHFHFDIINLFMDAYVAASETDMSNLVRQLNVEDEIERRILIEAAFASVATQDLIKPGEQSRIDILRASLPDSPVLVYQGLGGAFATTDLESSTLWTLKQNFFGWMALDCFGFHKGYFEWATTIDRMAVPANLDTMARYAFDCGVGRALWLIADGEPRVVKELVSRFAPDRRAALWSGIGLYTGFVGARDHNDLKKLRKLAGADLCHLQEGIGLAAFILNDAKQTLAHTKGASEIICGATLTDVLQLASDQLALNSTGDITAENFYNWKRNMNRFYSRNR